MPEPFNRRVRLVVEVREDPDELELASGVFAAQGWRVRPAREGDAITADDGYAALLVEVPLRGSRLTARSMACEHLTTLAARRRLDVRVREAKLIRPRPEAPDTTYHVHHKVPDGAGRVLRWVLEHWTAVGGRDVRHTLHLRGEYTEEQRDRARAELEQRNLGGAPFDPDAHDIRRPIGPGTRYRSADPRRRAIVIAAVGAVVVVSLACGVVLGSLATPWRLLALGWPLGMCWPVGTWVSANEPRPWLVRLGIGVSVVWGLTAVGALWASALDVGTAGQLAGFGVTAGLGFVVLGLWYALSESWFSRNMQWFLPVLAAPLPFVMPWVGSFLHAMYLEDFFGVPADSVHVAFYWQYVVAMRPLATAAGCGLVLVALAGWARHFNVQTGAAGLVRWVLPLMALVVVLTVASGAVGGVDRAAHRTMAAAAQGRRAPAYFGIRGDLVCIEPLTGKIPVINGPVPTRHPVLSFRASGDTVWLWDPDPARGRDTSRHALRLRAEDVQLVAATGRHCPARRAP
ncbi:hypothetical protein AB0E10_11100 [Streptomyces sp. NPDC048045]|uniref:hypothetical protein n=1 Tax=Streptomyces sp. NPDC048045 TaxID=3154710 RepID=UPI003413F5DC